MPRNQFLDCMNTNGLSSARKWQGPLHTACMIIGAAVLFSHPGLAAVVPANVYFNISLSPLFLTQYFRNRS